MAATIEPRFNLNYGWSLGESGWNTGMDANLLRLGHAGIHLSVKDIDLTAPPGSPANGDTYIPAATATGDWATHEGDVAVWDGTQWLFYVPRAGWLTYEEDTGKLKVYNGTTWVAPSL